MRNVDAATIAATQDPKGIITSDLVTIRAKTFAGVEVVFGFWSDSGDVAITVQTQTGGEEQRNFTGGGALIAVGEVALTQSLDVRQLPITLSQVHPMAQNLARGHELRAAPVEVHRVLFDTETRLAVAPAQLHFIGEVDHPPVDTPATGEEGSIRLVCVSDTRQLTRVNHGRRGLAQSQGRSGDLFLTHSGQVAQWEVWWGEEGSRRPGAGTAGGGAVSGGGGGGRGGPRNGPVQLE